MAKTQRQPFTPRGPFVVARPFRWEGRDYKPGEDFNAQRMAVNQRRLRLLYDAKSIDVKGDYVPAEPEAAEENKVQGLTKLDKKELMALAAERGVDGDVHRPVRDGVVDAHLDVVDRGRVGAQGPSEQPGHPAGQVLGGLDAQAAAVEDPQRAGLVFFEVDGVELDRLRRCVVGDLHQQPAAAGGVASDDRGLGPHLADGVHERAGDVHREREPDVDVGHESFTTLM